MPKIVVKRKAEVYKEFPIRPFQSRISIGSEGDNDLIIADKLVSLHHLIIEKEGTRYFVRDNQSAFGSLLNGNSITERTLLSSGDEITIGEHTLVFENVLFEKSVIDEHPPESTEVVGEKEVFLTQSATTAMSETGFQASDAPEIVMEEPLEKIAQPEGELSRVVPEKLTPHYLLAIYGPYLGKKYRLNFGITRLGRDSSLNDIIIRENPKGEVDPSISRRHATILMQEGNYFITDKRSKTRTRINRQQLKEDDVIQLVPNDEIEIVSDQKSTIFRFVPEGMMDFSAPRKSGSWWIRNSHRVIRVASALVSLLFFVVMVNSWLKLSVIRQKPSPFKFEEQGYFIGQDEARAPMQPDAVLSIIPSLAPSAADLDGDGFLDVVYVDHLGYVKTINGKSRQPLWRNSLSLQVQFPLGVVLADLNNNRLQDILIPANNGMIYAVDGKTGAEIWSSPLLGGEFSGNPVVADLNGDQLQDIVVCSRGGQFHFAFGKFGSPAWSTLQVETEIKCPPSAGDVDNDGLLEVIVGTENGKILIFDGSKENFSHIININEEFQKAKGSFYEDHPIRQRIAIGRLNLDNYADLVVLTERDHLLVLEGKDFKRIWFDEIQPGVGYRSLIPPVLADLNGDGRLEVIFVNRSNTIIVYDGMGKSGGQKKIIWGYVSENVEQFVSYPISVDINKDGSNDVLIAGFYGGLYIFDGKDGKLIQGYKPIQQTADAIIGTPVVADFNRDKNLDILIRKNNDSFSTIRTNSMIEPGAILWGQINYNAYQAGCNTFTAPSASRLYFMIFLGLTVLFAMLGYNIYEPIRRRNMFKSK